MPYHIVWQVQLHTGQPPSREFLADFIAHRHVLSVETPHPTFIRVTMHEGLNTRPEDIAQDPNTTYTSHLSLHEGPVTTRIDDQRLYDAIFLTLAGNAEEEATPEPEVPTIALTVMQDIIPGRIIVVGQDTARERLEVPRPVTRRVPTSGISGTIRADYPAFRAGRAVGIISRAGSASCLVIAFVDNLNIPIDISTVFIDDNQPTTEGSTVTVCNGSATGTLLRHGPTMSRILITRQHCGWPSDEVNDLHNAEINDEGPRLFIPNAIIRSHGIPLWRSDPVPGEPDGYITADTPVRAGTTDGSHTFVTLPDESVCFVPTDSLEAYSLEDVDFEDDSQAPDATLLSRGGLTVPFWEGSDRVARDLEPGTRVIVGAGDGELTTVILGDRTQGYVHSNTVIVDEVVEGDTPDEVATATPVTLGSDHPVPYWHTDQNPRTEPSVAQLPAGTLAHTSSFDGPTLPYDGYALVRLPDGNEYLVHIGNVYGGHSREETHPVVTLRNPTEPSPVPIWFDRRDLMNGENADTVIPNGTQARLIEAVIINAPHTPNPTAIRFQAGGPFEGIQGNIVYTDHRFIEMTAPQPDPPPPAPPQTHAGAPSRYDRLSEED
jgi:hypothetical protein